MPAHTLTVTELSGPAPNGPVITAAWFETRLAREQTLANAERQSVSMLKAARRKAIAILRQAARHQRQIRRELLNERALLEQSLLRRHERQWVKRHVSQVLNEAEQERLLIRHAAERIQTSMAQALGAWCGQQPADEQLCARLARQVVKLAGEETLTLQVHPALVPQMRAAWGEQLTIVAAPYFARTQARLASVHCAVELSLDRHLADLMTWLRGTAAPAGEADENDRGDTGHGLYAGCTHPAGAGGAQDGAAGNGAA